MPRKLRPVQDGERAEKPQKPMTLAEAVERGTHRDLLVALRERLAQSVASPSTSAVALAALSRQLTLISKELSMVSAREEDDEIGQAAQTADEAFDASMI